MLKIRMQRTGRTNDPSYRIVVTEHTRAPKSANFVERLGTYNPKTKQRTLNTERVKHWLSMGAQASGTMHNMLITAGVIDGKKVNVLPKKSPPKKEEAPAEGAPAAEGAAPAPDSPVEEAKEEKPAEEAKEEKSAEEPKEESKAEEKPAPTEVSGKEEEKSAETAEAK